MLIWGVFVAADTMPKTWHSRLSYKPEHDYVIDGIKYRYFEARYTLSDSTVKTLGDSEPVLEEDKNKD